jgi:hypothetical protein
MARHGDEGPYSPLNVRICTGRENMREAHWKLTAPEVREIRASQSKNAVLAERYGVNRGTIQSIRAGKTWTHIL